MRTPRDLTNVRAARQVALAIVAALATAGCGSNAPEIPPELIDAIKSSNQATDGYPGGPYGTVEGEIIQNLCFDGWRDPMAAGYDPASIEKLCFADYYDQDDVELLVVNTGAIWCSACKVEWGGGGTEPSILEHEDLRKDGGVRVLGLIFQDAERDPATIDHAVTWAKSFDVDVPFGYDPDFQMGLFADQNIQPFNMVIDAKTMTILLQIEGDQPAVLWGFVDEELAARAMAQ